MELMVTIGIFSVISAVVIFKSTQFNSSIFLTNSAYEIALRIREAQSYGVGSKSAGDIGTDINAFRHRYGVYVDTGKTDFIIFIDKNDNDVYDSGEEMFIDKLQKDTQIGSMCFGPGAMNEASVNITFKRPNPGALIKMTEGSPARPYVGFLIKYMGDSIECRKITVTKTGQIMVSNGCSYVCS